MMKRYHIIASALSIFALAACGNEYGQGIGRAHREVDLPKTATCDYYISAVSPSGNSGTGFVEITAIANNDSPDNDYFLCSFGSCTELTLSSSTNKLSLPLGNLDLASSGEIALVVNNLYDSAANICGYLAWEQTNSDNGDSGSDQHDSQTETDDGSSETENNPDQNTDINQPDATTDGSTDTDNPGVQSEAAMAESTKSTADDSTTDGSRTSSSLNAAIIAGYWQAGTIFSYTDGCIMIPLNTKKTSGPNDWSCQ